MFGKKTLLATAAMAVLSLAGIGSASAAAWDHRHDHRGFDRHPALTMHRHYVDHARLGSSLRFHRYSMLGAPYFLHGHYLVRTHDRFGRTVIVEVDPYSGAFLGEFRI